MIKNISFACVAIACLAVSLASCKKDGLNSSQAKKIQYKWERFSSSKATDYEDGRPVTWRTMQAAPGYYLQFDRDGYFYDIYSSGSSNKYQYKVDGNKILSLYAGNASQATTPQYTDTTFINQVDDHLLVLSHRSFFVSGSYRYVDLYLDSLKK